MMKHIEGTRMDYDIFDNKYGRGIQIVERDFLKRIKSVTTKMLSKKLVYSYAGIKDMRVRKSILTDNMKTAQKYDKTS